jgi:hypothetical protein
MENIENIESLTKALGLDFSKVNDDLKEEMDYQQQKVIKLFLAKKALEEYEKEKKESKQKLMEIMSSLGGEVKIKMEEVYDEWYSFKLYGETFDVGF